MNKKSWKKLCSVALSLALLGTLLSACGGGGTPAPGAAGDKKEVVIGHVYSETHNLDLPPVLGPVAMLVFESYLSSFWDDGLWSRRSTT